MDAVHAALWTSHLNINISFVHIMELPDITSAIQRKHEFEHGINMECICFTGLIREVRS